MGVVPPAEGFLERLRELADASGALLILDEVITGFRVARGGAQELPGVDADLTVMGKVLGGGLPAAAYGGPRALMERIAPAATSTRRGRFRAIRWRPRPGSRPCGALDESAYLRLGELTEQLAAGLRDEAGGAPVKVVSVPGLVTLFFASEPVTDFAGANLADVEAYAVFCRGMLERGVYPRSRSSGHGSSRSPTTAQAAIGAHR